MADSALPDVYFKFSPDLPQTDVHFAINQNQSLVSWDKTGGKLLFDWDPKRLAEPNQLHSFYPRCAGFRNGKVIDDEGHVFPLDYWTPNGTADIFLPQAGAVKSQWMMEIGEKEIWDCRDRYDELPADLPKPTPKVLSPEQEEEIQKQKDAQAQVKNDLRMCNPNIVLDYLHGESMLKTDNYWNRIAYGCARHDDELKAILGPQPRAEQLTAHFATLPAAVDVQKHAATGADLLVRSMKADNATGPEQAQMLYEAMAEVLSAHHAQKKRWTWTPFDRRAAGEDLIHATIDAVIKVAEPELQSWMQMISIGAALKAVREIGEAGNAGACEQKTVARMFERFG